MSTFCPFKIGLTSPAWVKKSTQQAENTGVAPEGYLSITLPRETASSAKTTLYSVVGFFLGGGGRGREV